MTYKRARTLPALNEICRWTCAVPFRASQVVARFKTMVASSVADWQP